MELLRVVHLSTSTQGGAGIAAQRLNSGLLNLGVDSRIVTIGTIKQLLPSTNSFNYIFYKIISKFFTFLNLLYSKKSFFSIYSASITEFELNDIGDPKNTILHIHNWLNLLNLKQLTRFANSGYKLVFTFHDERLITGGCHSSMECPLIGSCSACPSKSKFIQRQIRRNLRKQQEFFQKHQANYVVISPSNWLKIRAQTFGSIHDSSIVQIPNYFSFPKNLDLKYSNRFLDTHLKIGIASVDPFNYIKGGDFVKIISQASVKESLNIELVFMKDFETNNTFWSNIDVLLVPSLSENSPNVIYEAAENYVPVIATPVGGIPELMWPELDLLFSPTLPGLAKTLLTMRELVVKPDFTRKLKQKHDHFGKVNESIIGLHLDLYQELLNLDT